MKYTAVKNPVWANEEQTAIDCQVDFDDLQEEFVPFTASPFDASNPASVEIFNDCVAGKYGTVTDYVAPPTYVVPAISNKEKAIQLLTETDWVNQPDVVNTSVTPHLLNQAEFITYRASLRAIAINPVEGFILFPTKPQEQWSQ